MPLFPSRLLIPALLALTALAPAASASPPTPPTGTSAAAPGAPPSVLRREVGTALYEIVHSPRQQAVFVASAGGLAPDAKDAPPSRVLRLHPDTLAQQAEIALPARGFGLALDDAGERLYVLHGLDAMLSVIDTRDNRLLHTLRLAERLPVIDTSDPYAQKYPHYFRHMAFDPLKRRLYLPGHWFSDSAVYVIDTEALKVERIVPGQGFLATGVALDAERGRLFVSSLAGKLFTFDTATMDLLEVAEPPADQALYLTLDTPRQRLYVVDQGLPLLHDTRRQYQPDFQPRSPGNRVLVLDAADRRLLATLPVGAGPVAALADATGERLYVSSRGAGTLTVFDTGNHQHLHTVPLPTHPNSLALDAERKVLYVTVKHADTPPTAPPPPESVVRIAFE